MGAFVLIVIFQVATVSGHDSRVNMRESRAVTMQEFSSRASCEAAAKTVEQVVWKAVCVPK